jgi:hypothetical protein
LKRVDRLAVTISRETRGAPEHYNVCLAVNKLRRAFEETYHRAV